MGARHFVNEAAHSYIIKNHVRLATAYLYTKPFRKKYTYTYNPPRTNGDLPGTRMC